MEQAIFDLGMGSTYSINAATEHPEAVADFLTYYFSPEAQAAALVDCGMHRRLWRSPRTSWRVSILGMPGLSPDLPQSSQEGNYGYTTWTFWPPKTDIYIYERSRKFGPGR